MLHVECLSLLSEVWGLQMDNTLIDDRRIHVDFSQSVSRLWSRFRRFGTKDAGGEGTGTNPIACAPSTGASSCRLTRRYETGAYNGNSGCFKCGESGHFAKDCTNDAKAAANEGPPETMRYEIKEDGKQRGNVGKQ